MYIDFGNKGQQWTEKQPAKRGNIKKQDMGNDVKRLPCPV